MQLELWPVAMKLLTFVGVVAAAMGILTSLSTTRALRRFFALGAVGVALMVANVWLASSWVGIVIDAAFAFVAVLTLTRAVQAAARDERAGAAAGAAP